VEAGWSALFLFFASWILLEIVEVLASMAELLGKSSPARSSPVLARAPVT
jgi:hypothetical protein